MLDAIKIKNLSKTYGNLKAVDDLNLSIQKGELFALLGVNGAGKSTTIKMLTCLTKPDCGDAFVLGNSIINDTNRVKELVNVSPQETSVAPKLTVYENLDFIAGVYNIANKKQKIEQIIKDFSLESVLKKKANTLSGGYQRRLSIAMALINEPKVLFLDEPTLGLDVIARRELWKIINGLKKNTTIILTTHYMEEAESLSDRIGIMAHGKLIKVGTSQELIKKANAKNIEEAFITLATGGEL